MNRMVVGFAFRENDIVYLIKKNRPEFQKGKLNGIGGHIEEGETPIDAMKREFLEEAGVEIKNWTYVALLEGDNWSVDVFAVDLPPSPKIKSMTDEEIDYYFLQELYYEDTLPNVKFLVPMCREHLDNPYSFKKVKIEY